MSEHIPTGEHDCVWFSGLILLFLFFAKPLLTLFIHNSCTFNVTKLSARPTFQHHIMYCIHGTKLALVPGFTLTLLM